CARMGDYGGGFDYW
nr:immunoglobulin heavy chain junction region [Mus musculus]MBK4186842.1 immunoglobulin heavy chain junction region [Mus musculus]